MLRNNIEHNHVPSLCFPGTESRNMNCVTPPHALKKNIEKLITVGDVKNKRGLNEANKGYHHHWT